MAKKGPVRSEERRAYWQAVIELQRESRLSIRKFCQQEGLAESAFYFWRRELIGRDDSWPNTLTPTASPPKFVPVEIKPTSHWQASPPHLVIELASGTKLSIHEHCSPELLRATLELLPC